MLLQISLIGCNTPAATSKDAPKKGALAHLNHHLLMTEHAFKTKQGTDIKFESSNMPVTIASPIE